MASRASKFLSNIRLLEQDGVDMNPAQEPDQPAVDNIPGDADQNPDQPHDDLPGQQELQQLESSMEQDPNQALNVLEACGRMTERYMNEEDPSWTPGDEEEKDAVGQAKVAIDQACESLRRFRK